MPLKRKITKRKIIKNPSQRNAIKLLSQMINLNNDLKLFITNEHIVEFAGDNSDLFYKFKDISKKLILKLNLINDRLVD